MKSIFTIYENGKPIGQVLAKNSAEAIKDWIVFAGPGNYTAKI